MTDDRDRLIAAHDQAHAVIDAMVTAAQGGEVSDFMASFPEVRSMVDLRSQQDALLTKLKALEKQWRVLAKDNRIDARDEPDPQLGRVAAAVHEACADDLRAALAEAKGR